MTFHRITGTASALAAGVLIQTLASAGSASIGLTAASSAVAPVGLLPPTTVASPGPSSGPGMTPLPGQYAIYARQTHGTVGSFVDLETFFTAADGGGQTTDAITFNCLGTIGASQKFTLWKGTAYYAIQTANGDFMTAANGGGLTTNALQTFSTGIVDEGLFSVAPQSGHTYSPHFALGTTRGYFLTAILNDNYEEDTIHTDATKVGAWELFDLIKCGNPGTGSTYSFSASSDSEFLTATDGGGHVGSTALGIDEQNDASYAVAFTPIRQADGSYALQTSGDYYLTAIGGGVAGAEYRTDIQQVGNWQKFTLIPNNDDCTTYIKTPAGTYLSQSGGHIVNEASTSNATRWRMYVMAF